MKICPLNHTLIFSIYKKITIIGEKLTENSSENIVTNFGENFND